jgi:hypothetical protein
MQIKKRCGLCYNWEKTHKDKQMIANKEVRICNVCLKLTNEWCPCITGKFNEILDDDDFDELI